MRRALGLVTLLALLAQTACSSGGGNRDDGGDAASAAIFTGVVGPCPHDRNGDAGQVGASNAGAMGGLGGGASDDASSPSPAPSAAACKQLSPEVEAYFDRIAKARVGLPETGYSAAAVATALGADPDLLFAYVRDKIRTEPYAGTMRGNDGTVQSRGGSPSDKAMLLASLLGAHGIAARFAHVTLTDAESARVLAAANAPLDLSIPGATSDGGTYATLGIDPVKAKAFVDDVRSTSDSDVAAGLAQAHAATAPILAALVAAGGALATDDARARTARIAAVRDHWFVQADLGGTWTDLDPSLVELTRGKHLGAAPVASVAALPQALATNVTVRLTGIYDGAPAKTLAEVTAETSETYGQALRVAFESSAKTLADVGTTRSFVPVVSLGGQTQRGDALVPDPPNGPRLSAVTLEIVTAIPGSPTHTATRTVIDRRASGTIGASWTPERTAYALATQYFGLAVPGEIDPDFALAHEADAMASFHALASAAVSAPTGAPSSAEAFAYPIPAMRALELDRNLRASMESASGDGVRFLVDRPQIVLYHQAFAKRTAAVGVDEEIDVVENGMSVGGTRYADAVRANVDRGYIDDSIERFALASPTATGTIALFAAAAKAGIATKTNRDAGGSYAIAPATAVALGGRDRSGWWSLDPRDGNMVGRMDSGAGQALTEYEIKLQTLNSAYGDALFFGRVLTCFVGFALEMDEDVSRAASNLGQCEATALCSWMAGQVLGGFLKSAWERAQFAQRVALYYSMQSRFSAGVNVAGMGCRSAVGNNPYKTPTT